MDTPEATLPTVSRFWKEFDLEGRRPQYDAIGFQIAEYQEESVQRRRQLAEATQKFRRGAERHIISAVGELLKQYQQEVDRLTKRSKYGERAFLDVYHELYEAPDPARALETGIETVARVKALEKEVQRQALELAEYSAESEELRNQDAKIRRLEEKIRSLETEAASKEASTDVLRLEVEEQVMTTVKTREAALERGIQEAETKLETIRKLHQASQDQLLLMQSKDEEMKASHMAELEMATAEIEKLHNRVMELETEKDKWRQPLAADTPPPNPDAERARALESELEMEREKLEEVKTELATLQESSTRAESEASERIRSLEMELKDRAQGLEVVEAALRERPTQQLVEDLKNQLKIFQAVEYNTEGDLTSKMDSMEGLLIKKNKHLEHQLTLEKLKQADIQTQLADQQTLLTKAQSQLEVHRDLVIQLEDDLTTAQNSNSLKPVSSASDLEEAIQEGTSGSSMATILRNQRDRLKQKTQELESKLRETERQNTALKTQTEAVLADNVAMVERLRYLQGYRKDRSQAADVESGLAAEQKYSKEYEDRINPFYEFQGRQRERRRKDLNLVDRTVLIVGDLVFGYKYARVFLCLYIMLLHVLVMVMLGFMSDRHHHPTDSDLEKMCLEHGFGKLG